MRSMMMALAMAGSVVSAGAQTAGGSVTLTPNPIGLGQNRFEATVKDATGQPITNAEVFLSLVMPADPKTKHPEMRTEGRLNNAGAGKYDGIVMVTMVGAWQVTVTASRSGAPIGVANATLTAPATRPSAAAPGAKPAAPQHGPATHTHAAAAAVKSPVAANADSIAQGAALFARQCVSCHGASGKGDGAVAAKLKSKPSDLTDAQWTHGPSDGEIFTLIRDGAKNAGMKAYRGVLTDDQMWHLVNHIRNLGPPR